ncbi:hypothetical protein ACFU53_26780 [Streptomyces sp. NPDC057474]|uniref:hypothetical protein n=1 Tax=Streptomyces sp. NPDC057474 TaxID=3346144 RepID=UPI0036841130
MQKVLDFPAFTTDLIIGLPGLLTVLGGTIAPRLLGRIGAPAVLSLSLVVQCVGYGVLLLLGESSSTGVVPRPPRPGGGLLRHHGRRRQHQPADRLRTQGPGHPHPLRPGQQADQHRTLTLVCALSIAAYGDPP